MEEVLHIQGQEPKQAVEEQLIQDLVQGPLIVEDQAVIAEDRLVQEVITAVEVMVVDHAREGLTAEVLALEGLVVVAMEDHVQEDIVEEVHVPEEVQGVQGVQVVQEVQVVEDNSKRHTL